VAAGSAFAGQEVTEIPISDWPTGAAALGAASIGAQNPFYTTDDGDDWKSDLIPLVLYNGKYVFFRGTASSTSWHAPALTGSTRERANSSRGSRPASSRWMAA
jgi:hypothetical protein